MKKIVFITRISKSGNKLYIRVPQKYRGEVEHGKTYRVIVEGPLEEG